MILVAKNIGQDGEFLAFKDEAHGDASYRPLERHTGIHHREAAAADRGHRRRAVRLGDLRNQTDRVREGDSLRQDSAKRAPDQLAMADFAAAWRTHAARLAYRVRREVVVQHEALAVAAVQRVDNLLVVTGAESRGHKRLGLTAGEERRAVGAWQCADFAVDVANRVVLPSVEALFFGDDVGAHHFVFHVAKVAGDFLLLGVEVVTKFFFELAEQVRFAFVELGVPLDFVAGGERITKTNFFGHLRDVVKQRLINIGGREDHLLLAHDFTHLVARRDDLLAFSVGKEERVDELAFRHFFAAALDHHDGVFGHGDHEVHVAVAELLEGGVNDELAVDAGHANTSDGARLGRPRKGRAMEGHRRTTQREDVGVVHAVVRNDGGDDLHFVAEAFGEERTNRAVSDAGVEHFVLPRTRFALEEAAGDFACGVGLLDVLTSEGEEVEARAGSTVAHRRQNDGVAPADPHRATGLLGDATGLKGHGGATDVDGHRMDFVRVVGLFDQTRRFKRHKVSSSSKATNVDRGRRLRHLGPGE